MTSRSHALSSSVGGKILVGLTGLALFAYLVVHIAGNAVVFLGPETFNTYSHRLLGNPLIPAIEVGLVIIFVLHVYKTVRMFLSNRRARPRKYARKAYAGPPSRKTFASSTMIASGLWLLAFIAIHVKQFKYGAEYADAAGVRDLYRLEMENFHHPLIVAFYVVSMLVVGSHLWHGVASGLQSIGADHPRWTPRVLVFGKAMAVLIAAAFIAIVVWAHVAGRRG